MLGQLLLLSLELMISWNCKFVVRSSTKVCYKRLDRRVLLDGHTDENLRHLR